MGVVGRFGAEKVFPGWQDADSSTLNQIRGCPRDWAELEDMPGGDGQQVVVFRMAGGICASEDKAGGELGRSCSFLQTLDQEVIWGYG